MNRAGLARMAFDFRASRALFAGLELGLFDALADGTEDAAELARRCAADERGLGVLLRALVALGVIDRTDGGFSLPAAIAPLLVEKAADSRASLWQLDLWSWSRWARLGEAVRAGAAPAADTVDPFLSSPEVLRRMPSAYARAMEQSADDAAATIARRLAPLRPARVLDLGGGTGAVLAALLGELPDARATLADRSFVLAAARERLAADNLSARVYMAALDFERDPLPADQDLVILSRVLMGLAPDRARALVLRAAEALAPGGAVAVHDYDARSRVGALLSLDVLLQGGGQVHEAASIEGWLREGGLVCDRRWRVLPYTRLWLGRKSS
jgi:SAM-dependent methyltransferase